MSVEIDFLALFGASITEEFTVDDLEDTEDVGEMHADADFLEDLDKAELQAAAEDHLDSLSEAELRNMYREGVITIDDPLVVKGDGN